MAMQPATFRGEPLPKEWQWELSSIDRVYVIGAGASVPYGLPTLKTLAASLLASLDQSDRDTLATSIRESFPTEVAENLDVDYEELLNRLNPDALAYLELAGASPPDSPRRRAAFLALRGLHDYLLDRCRLAANQTGPLDILVKAIDARSVIVSFNWDVLLELAVLRAGRQYAYLPPGLVDSGVLLLKPHGSINWFALLDRELLMVNASSNLWVIGPRIDCYMCYKISPLDPVDFSRTSVQYALARTPAIVPPSASRLLDVGGRPRDGFVAHGHDLTMQATWLTVAQAIGQARQIVLIGYSLPGTDGATIELFKFASRREAKKREWLVVNRDPSVIARYRTVLDIDARQIGADFAEFDPTAI